MAVVAAAVAAALQQRDSGRGNIGSLAAARRWQLDGGCSSMAVVAAAAVAALQQRNSGGCSDGSFAAAAWWRCGSGSLVLAVAAQQRQQRLRKQQCNSATMVARHCQPL